MCVQLLRVYLLSIGINIMNCDAKNEQTHQRCYSKKTHSNASLGRVKQDDKTSEEEGEGKVNEN